MKPIDFEKAGHLLNTIQLAAANGAMYGALISEAMVELKTISEDAQSNQADRAKEAQQNESKAQAKALAAEPETNDKAKDDKAPEPVTRPVQAPPQGYQPPRAG
jgi:hypothetical protein